MAINIDHTGAGQVTLKSPASGTGELTLPTGGGTLLSSSDPNIPRYNAPTANFSGNLQKGGFSVATTEDLDDVPLLGVGQTWQSFTTAGDTPQRQHNVTYTNTTGRPIMVSIQDNTKNSSFNVGGVGLQSFTELLTAIVPPNATYRVTAFQTPWLTWRELR